MLDTKHFITDLNLWFREQVLDLTANHGFDQVCIGDSIYIVGTDVLRVTEYGNSACQTVHILKTMGNEDNGNSFFL